MYFKTPRQAAPGDLALAELITQAAAVIITNHQEAGQRVEAEEALRKSEDQLKKLNILLEQEVDEQTADLIKQHSLLTQAEEIAEAGSWEYNVQTKEFLWSDGMYRLFDQQKGGPVTPAIYLQYAVKEDQPIARRIVDAIEKNFMAAEETLRMRFNDACRTLRIKIYPLVNEKGELEKMLGVDMDISRLVKASDDIIELNRSLIKKNETLESLNTELKTFNSIAAKDYKETIQTLYTNLEYIISNEGHHLSDSSKANIRRAQSAIQRMKLLTADINAYLHLYDVRLNPVWINTNELLQTVLTGMQYKLEQVNARVETASLPSLPADPALFMQLVEQLIDNAIKFHRQDVQPLISVNWLLPQESPVTFDRLPSVGYGIISFADNGTGFPPEESERIFDLFYRIDEKSKHRSPGTGLAICKKIMSLHEGFIKAEGKPGTGAVFYCVFPLNGPVNHTS